MKLETKKQTVEALQKILELTTNIICKSTEKQPEWDKWKNEDAKVSYTEINELGALAASALCEIEGEGEPWWMRGWTYLSPIDNKFFMDYENERTN